MLGLKAPTLRCARPACSALLPARPCSVLRAAKPCNNGMKVGLTSPQVIRPTVCKAAEGPAPTTEPAQQQGLIGEDAAAFDWSQQSLKSWGLFGALLTTVMGALYLVSLHQLLWVVPQRRFVASAGDACMLTPETTIVPSPPHKIPNNFYRMVYRYGSSQVLAWLTIMWRGWSLLPPVRRPQFSSSSSSLRVPTVALLA